MTDDIDPPSRPSTPSPNDRIKKSKVRRSLTPALLAAQSSKKKTPSTPVRRTASSPLKPFSSIESTKMNLYTNSASKSTKTTQDGPESTTKAVGTASEKIDKEIVALSGSNENDSCEDDNEKEGGGNKETSVKEREKEEIEVEEYGNAVFELEVLKGNAGSNAEEEVISNDKGVGRGCGEQG